MPEEEKFCNLYAAGISHECADADAIGAFGIEKDACSIAEKLIMETSGSPEILVLSTCNRVEIYFVARSEIDCEKIARTYARTAAKNADPDAFARLKYVKKNADAVRHLFEVASGLLSKMTGETEILGQVKAAYARAAAAGHCGPILNAVFQKANQCAKWVRTNTDIGRGKISLGSVASELADRIFDDISKAKILLVGSGEAGKLVAEALYLRGAKDITVASRTRANADALAAEIGVSSAELSDSLAALPNYDITVCASFSQQPLIAKNDVQTAVEKRGGKPMFLIDLAVPRNIEADCGDVDDAYLYNLEDLSRIANENMAARRAEIESARAAIAEKALGVSEKFWK